MNDSRIEVSKHSTTFVGADAVDLYRLMQIRSGIRLHKSSGMLLTRGATITKLLAMVTAVTQKPYKGKTKHDAALADLDQRIAALQASMPIEARKH
jgi:hypothetical protein